MARPVVVQVIGDARKFNRTATQVDTKASRLGKSFSGLGSKIKGALAGAGIAAGIGFLGSAVKSAIAGEQAQAKLTQALQRTTHATSEQVGAVKDYIAKSALATGVTKGELRPAYTNLLNATRSVSKSTELMNTALDVSARTGKPLATVTLALGKAYNGNVGALGRLGLKTKDAAGHALTFEQAQKELNKTFGGAAAAAADTTAGKFARLKVQFAAIQAEVGAKLLPVLNKLADLFLKHRGLVVAFVAALASLAIITKIVNMVKAFRAAMEGLNLAFATNPVVLIAAAIIALGVGIFIAYKKCKPFRDAVDAIGRVIRSVFDWVRDHWKLLGVILLGPIAPVLLAFFTFRTQILGIIGGVIDWIRGHWRLLLAILTGPIGAAVLVIVAHFRAIKGFADNLVGFFAGIPGRLGGALRGIGNALSSPFRAAFDLIKRLWNDFVGALRVPGGAIGRVFGAVTSHLPHFAQGGIVTRPTLAVVGEKGPEAIVPLGRKAVPARGGVTYVNVTMNVPTGAHGAQVGRQLYEFLKQYERSSGPLQLRVANGGR